MIEMENGGIYKSIHGDLYKNSAWFCIYGEKGRMESAREDARQKMFPEFTSMPMHTAANIRA